MPCLIIYAARSALLFLVPSGSHPALKDHRRNKTASEKSRSRSLYMRSSARCVDISCITHATHQSPGLPTPKPSQTPWLPIPERGVSSQPPVVVITFPLAISSIMYILTLPRPHRLPTRPRRHIQNTTRRRVPPPRTTRGAGRRIPPLTIGGRRSIACEAID